MKALVPTPMPETKPGGILKNTNVNRMNSNRLIYNDSATGKPAVCTIGFGSVQSADNGTFTITFPAPGGTGSNAIIRIT